MNIGYSVIVIAIVSGMGIAPLAVLPNGQQQQSANAQILGPGPEPPAVPTGANVDFDSGTPDIKTGVPTGANMTGNTTGNMTGTPLADPAGFPTEVNPQVTD